MSADQVNPWQQGELDGLCGIYSIINAMKHLALSRGMEFSDPAGTILFRRMVRYLHKRNKLPHALWDGTSFTHVKDFIAEADRFMKREYGLELTYKTLARKGQITRKDVFWRVLDGALRGDETRGFGLETPHPKVALLGLGLPSPHWTLAYQVTNRSIRLIDSGSRYNLKYSQCTLGVSKSESWVIEPEHTFLLSTL